MAERIFSNNNSFKKVFLKEKRKCKKIFVVQIIKKIQPPNIRPKIWLYSAIWPHHYDIKHLIVIEMSTTSLKILNEQEK